MNACLLINELIEIHGRSLPVYLNDASPWMGGEQSDQARDVVEIVAADHLATVERLVEAALERDCDVRKGGFPTYFTGLHDLSLDYLLRLAAQEQKKDIRRIGELAEQCQCDARLSAIAQEAYGAAQGHWESLSEMVTANH